MLFKSKKSKTGEPQKVSEEMLLDKIAEIRTRLRDAEIERLQKANELKSFQKETREIINDANRFNRLTKKCARAEMLAEHWDSVIDNINDAAFIFERIRTYTKSASIQADINEFFDVVKMKDPQLALNLDEFQKNLSQLSISTIAQLDQMEEIRISEPELEEKIKEWGKKLKEGL